MSQVLMEPFLTMSKSEPKFQNPERIQQNILSSVEKKTLIWIAKRLPEWIHSDHLTIIGFLGMILTGASYLLSSWTIYAPFFATFFLAVNWFGDSLDGTVARVRNRQRPRYGFYVDHAIDTIGVLFLIGGLAASGYMSSWVAAGFLIAYYFLCIEMYLTTATLGKFKMSFGLFGPTELRILLAIGNIALVYHPMVHLFGKELRAFDAGGIPAIVVLMGFGLYAMGRTTIEVIGGANKCAPL